MFIVQSNSLRLHRHYSNTMPAPPTQFDRWRSMQLWLIITIITTTTIAVVVAAATTTSTITTTIITMLPLVVKILGLKTKIMNVTSQIVANPILYGLKRYPCMQPNYNAGPFVVVVLLLVWYLEISIFLVLSHVNHMNMNATYWNEFLVILQTDRHTHKWIHDSAFGLLYLCTRVIWQHKPDRQWRSSLFQYLDI